LNPGSWPINPATKLWDLDGTDLYVYAAETFVCEFGFPDRSSRHLQIFPRLTAGEVRAILMPSTRPEYVRLYQDEDLPGSAELTKPGRYYLTVQEGTGKTTPVPPKPKMEGDLIAIIFHIGAETLKQEFSPSAPIAEVRKLWGDRPDLMHCGMFLQDDQVIGDILGISEHTVHVLTPCTDFQDIEKEPAVSAKLPEKTQPEAPPQIEVTDS
jgi:hypothetical protein